MKPAIFYGVGVGPGDPELMTLKAHRLIQQVDVLVFLVNKEGQSQAKAIAQNAIDEATKKPMEIPVFMPMSVDREQANHAYNDAAKAIKVHLEQGRHVAFLCEGDPFFYGSFIYLMERLHPAYPCEIVSGISSLHAASAALKTPLVQQSETLAVISGRVSDAHVSDTLKNNASVVILKAGQNRPRLMALIEAAGRAKDAEYIEYISRENQKITPYDALDKKSGPYFSLFFITQKNTRKNIEQAH